MLGPKAARNEKAFNKIDELLALWKAFWYHGIEKKNIPRFSVLVAKLFEKTDAKRTHLTYLKSITDYSNLIEIFYHSRTLS